VDILGLIVSHL